MLKERNFEQGHPADDELRKGRSKEQIGGLFDFDHNWDMTVIIHPLHHVISVFI